ncbi:unnamed protein product [Clonostachys rhizophaga]|uniref:Uncharacterized protein n=1 Tax=Clonostachys rhizophaga TaxID=160324 RepID=A0A9N9VNV7_9HYPO|nr:unnamed protein product [Clonostachys rhizophaga]
MGPTLPPRPIVFTSYHPPASMAWVMHERFLASTLIDESAFATVIPDRQARLSMPYYSSFSTPYSQTRTFVRMQTAPDGCGHAATPKATIFWHLWGIQTSKFRVHGYGMAPDIVGLLVLNLGGMPRLELKPSLRLGLAPQAGVSSGILAPSCKVAGS